MPLSTRNSAAAAASASRGEGGGGDSSAGGGASCKFDVSARLLKRRRRESTTEQVNVKKKCCGFVLSQPEKNAFFDKIRDLYDAESMCDITFQVENVMFRAHRVVLAGHHAFFSALLTTGMMEGSQDVIELKDTDPALFKLLLDYTYSKDVSVAHFDIVNVLSLATRYQLDGLRDQLCNTLAANLDADNAISVFAAADTFACDRLKERAFAKVMANFAMDIKSESFVSLNLGQLQQLLTSDHILDCDESLIFEAAVRWLRADSQRKSLTHNVLSFVRFPLMDAGLLSDVIKLHPIMQLPDCPSLLMEAYEHQALVAAGRPGHKDSPRTHPRRRSCSFMRHQLLMEHEDAVSALTVINGRLVSGSWDTTIKVWNPETWMCERTLSDHTGTIRCFAVCKGRLISGSDDNSIRVWNPDSWTLVRAMNDHTDIVNAVIECSDRMVSGSDDGTMKLYNMNTWQCEFTIHHDDHQSGVIALATVGDYLVSGSDQNVIKVWDIHSWTCQKVLSDHTDEIWCLRVIGNRLVSGSIDSTLRVWNTEEDFVCESVLTEHSGAVYAMAVLDDKLVTASSDESIKIWDSDLSACERTLPCRGVWALTVYRDRLVSGSLDNAVKVWT